jgi:peroxiredoxin
MQLPAVGSIAPDFTLPSTAGGEVTLSALRGQNVLLAFFPLAFTRVCTDEMCAFSEDYDRFASRNTVVLPVSVDSIPTLQEFKRKEGLAVELLSDFMRTMSPQYGTFIPERNATGRAYVLVDRAGRVAWTHAEPHPGTRRENEELLAQLEQLAAVG